MIFQFEIKEGSIFSETSVTKQGDYTGPETMLYSIDGVEVELTSSNPTHIILMDLLDDSKWHTVDHNKVMSVALNVELGIYKKIYNLDTPSDGYTLNGLKLLENGDVDLQLDSSDLTIEQCRAELTARMYALDDKAAATTIPSRKQALIKEISKIDWVLNSLPPGVDIRDVIILEV